MWPPVPILPIAGVAPASVNQRLPSGPAVMKRGELPEGSPTVNFVIVPAVVIRPIACAAPASVNQRLPSGPGATSKGLSAVVRPLVNSLMVGVKALLSGRSARAQHTRRADAQASSKSSRIASK